jgi:peptide/nickel transport system permease protein
VRTKPLGAAGAAVILIMAFAAIFADVIAPYDAYELNQRLQFRAPTVTHWLGTDEFGRDVLTRLIYGARIALFIGLASSFIGATAGAILGVVSAYLGGKTDLWLQRVMDVMLAFPLLILALAIVTVLGRSLPNLILAIAIPVIPRTARIVRSSALSAKENVYVEAARAVGSTHLRVMFHHIVPNIMAPYLIVLTAQLGGAILTEASLSFLGLGTAEPTPSWGLMLSGGAPMYAEKAPWLAIFPGLVISLAVFGFNLFGDSLRDALDPKLRHRS